MRPFVFRAQAALDFRRRRHDDAKRELAAANASVFEAEAALESSVEQHDHALRDARDEEVRATGVATREWYRNWITVRRREVERRQETLAHRCAAADTARDRATRTHVEVRVLEKLQERARRTYDDAVRREEQKSIDWLAVIRTFTRQGGQEGNE